MAKLNGVKTIDMQNGKITKVAYEGAEYAKVEGKAEVGDLVLNVSETAFFTLGAFYLAFDTYSTGEPRMKDDDNDNLGMGEGNYALFRKISAQSKSTLEQVAKRVETLESDVAALKSSDSSLKGEKVAEEPKRLSVGDVAKIIGTESYHFGEIGDIVKIKIDAKDSQPYKCERISDGKDVGWFYEEDLEAYVEETIEFEGATYRKVEREAREGDVVIFRKNRSCSVGNNKPYLAENLPVALNDKYALAVKGSCNCRVYIDGYNRTRETDDVYEPIEQGVKDASKPKLKAGDYVKFKRGIHDTKADKPYLIEINPSYGELAFRDDVNDWCSIARSGEYEILSAEEAKWANIGRKPNEFKKGDVVRVLDTYNGHEIAGQLGEVVKPDGTDRPLVRAVYSDDLVSLYSRIELVAPVESLFNA